MAYTIIDDFIPESLYPLKAPYTMTLEYVTIHNTANDTTAVNEAQYVHNNHANTSYHVAIDDKNAVQIIRFNRNGFHAGDGATGPGNRKSIGIEICYSESGGQKYVDSEANAIEYIAHVPKQYGWRIDRVRWHRDWSGKDCPHRIFAEGRAQSVKDRIASRLAGLNGDKVVHAPKPAVKPSPSKTTTNPTPKPTVSKNLGLVDWMKANKMDSSFPNRAKLYGSGYAGTEPQNITLLKKLQNKTVTPVSKPAAQPKPAAKKNTVHLPKSAKTWRTYKTNVQPVKANSDWSLTPSAFGGITYEIVGRPQANVVTVNTSHGKRNIFVGPGTGAIIKLVNQKVSLMRIDLAEWGLFLFVFAKS